MKCSGVGKAASAMGVPVKCSGNGEGDVGDGRRRGEEGIGVKCSSFDDNNRRWR